MVDTRKFRPQNLVNKGGYELPTSIPGHDMRCYFFGSQLNSLLADNGSDKRYEDRQLFSTIPQKYRPFGHESNEGEMNLLWSEQEKANVYFYDDAGACKARFAQIVCFPGLHDTWVLKNSKETSRLSDDPRETQEDLLGAYRDPEFRVVTAWEEEMFAAPHVDIKSLGLVQSGQLCDVKAAKSEEFGKGASAPTCEELPRGNELSRGELIARVKKLLGENPFFYKEILDNQNAEQHPDVIKVAKFWANIAEHIKSRYTEGSEEGVLAQRVEALANKLEAMAIGKAGENTSFSWSSTRAC